MVKTARRLHDTRYLIYFPIICCILLNCASLSKFIGLKKDGPVEAISGMVVSAHPLASEVGIQILQEGGTAVDAAVATAFALGVVEPYHSGIGGGGFMLIRFAESGEVISIDFRETAPSQAHRETYVRDGEVVEEWSTVGAKAAAVPGLVAGLCLALREYGTLSLEQVLSDAEQYARSGFRVWNDYDRYAESVLAELLQPGVAPFQFIMERENPSKIDLSGEDYLLVQKDLARTLGLIAEKGSDVFYRGEIAEKIADWMAENNGLITQEDLASYRPVLREPVRGTYRGYEIVSMPPPTSGGVNLLQMLNILEGFDLNALGHNSPETIHLITETMKLAFADRAFFLGDPDFVDVPVEGLISKKYAEALRKKIDLHKASEIRNHGEPLDYSQKGGTTHISVIDKQGNVVSLTQTINLNFGAKVVVPGTGILLNNEMDDFSLQPGVPNAYNLIGGEANAIAPGKRPLSSMAPTIVLKDGKPYIIVGSPGGPRIITTVLQVISNIIDHGLDIQKAVDAPRVHHQWLPDTLMVEKGISDDVKELLIKMGHEVQQGGPLGAAQGILIDPQTGVYYGWSDPRLDGKAVGY
ncbi:MAG: gamma-glutamyltransferase [Gemmatimonadota bacterium]|nr:MAG: gamma-glutamyltransferase [Gemmatimonadota bacterium]